MSLSSKPEGITKPEPQGIESPELNKTLDAKEILMWNQELMDLYYSISAPKSTNDPDHRQEFLSYILDKKASFPNVSMDTLGSLLSTTENAMGVMDSFQQAANDSQEEIKRYA